MNSISPHRRWVLYGAIFAPLAALCGCRGGFNLLGYQVGADALYDANIKTVYVPLFNNRAFQTTPYRGFEVDVTQAVIREIGKTTSFRVSSDYTTADTELLGNIVSIQHNLLNRNQLNLTREAELVVAVDVVWRDLRDGTILSNPRKRPVPGRTILNPTIDGPPIPFDPTIERPPELPELEAPVPMRIVATGRILPELGETNASASTRIHNQIAVQIVSMMEKRW
ncbi:MAG: LPS assembly lipoprotein LptE [Gemmataceae bacterium]|nr:LPS assembly lipoprotein LptE [Gemmata sp.]MDW8196666.1 LPS assembly lipoprotein LptE [Gemmataceae bacterium]